MTDNEKIFDKLLSVAMTPQPGYIVTVILSDGSDKRIPYIESQRPQAEAFIAMMKRHGITAWLSRP